MVDLGIDLIHGACPATSVPPKVLQEYFKLLWDKDIMKYRIPEIKNPDIRDMNKIIQDPNGYSFVVFDRELDTICAEVTLDNLQGRSCMVHFSANPNFKGLKTLRVGQFAIKTIFELEREDGTPYVNTLLGLTAESNRLAQKFRNRLMFKKIARIPEGFYIAQHNRYEAGILSQRTRD